MKHALFKFTSSSDGPCQHCLLVIKHIAVELASLVETKPVDFLCKAHLENFVVERDFWVRVPDSWVDLVTFRGIGAHNVHGLVNSF